MKLLEDRTNLAQIVIYTLCKRNITIKQLSEQTDIGYLSLQKLLNGEVKRPSFITVYKIHKYLNISIDELAEAIQKDNGR